MSQVYAYVATSIGQDSHRFCDSAQSGERKLMLGGVEVGGAPPLDGNSDADVILHALTNAISGLSGEQVLALGRPTLP